MGGQDGGWEACRVTSWSVPYITKEVEDGEGPWVIFGLKFIELESSGRQMDSRQLDIQLWN